MLCTHTFIYICTDRPVVQITTITSGLNNVSVSWTSNSNGCTVAMYEISLTSQGPGGVDMSTSVTTNSHTFTELPDNTEFVFLLNAVTANGIVSETERRTVRTMMSESMCTCICINVIRTEIQYEFLIFK